MSEIINVNNIDVHIEGSGSETIVMIHGWPDTYRLWDPQVELLKERYRTVRFTLPGFDKNKERKVYYLQDEIDAFEAIIDTVSPDQPVTLLLHDWGCFFGYQYYMQNKRRVKRIIGVDVGDAGSKDMKLPLKMVLFTVYYQLFLTVAWLLGGRIGDKMTRYMANFVHAPGDPDLIWSGMTYGYYVKWKHILSRKSQGNVDFFPECPMLFYYGKNKPTMFHSEVFEKRLAQTEDCEVHGLDARHWVMTDEPQKFNAILLEWLKKTNN